MTRKTLGVAVLVAIALAAVGFLTKSSYPPLQDGDLVFQTSSNPQSLAILAATASLFSHVGIVEKTPDGDRVIDAANVVRDIPLSQWMQQGVMGRIAIYRYQSLTETQGHDIVTAASHYEGTPYDMYFSFKSHNMYCSKLPYLAYKEAGLSAGTLQTFGDLHMDNSVVKNLIEERRHQFPDCADKDFAGCYDYLMQQPIITPVALARDAHFKEIYSNYSPF